MKYLNSTAPALDRPSFALISCQFLPITGDVISVKEKSPAFQWYPKQYLGDNKVTAMDWDARGMHTWLLNMSWQEDPRGTIPNDTAVIRRWLGSPSDEIWRRVWPQIMTAWLVQDGRLVNAGMVRAAEKQANYSKGNKGKEKYANGTQIGTQIVRKSHGGEDESLSIKEISIKAELVYSAYPRKVGKPAAIRAITAKAEAVAKSKGVDRAEAFRYLYQQTEKYARSPDVQGKLANGEPQFIPHPATWFNEERFENEADWNGQNRLGKSGVFTTKQQAVRAANEKAARESEAALGIVDPDPELLPAGDERTGTGTVAGPVIEMPVPRGR